MKRVRETLQNGALQRAAAAEFDVLLTVDRKMSFQTSLTGLDLCVIVVRVNRNRLDHLQVMLPAIEAEILKSVPGSFVTIEP